MDSIYRLLSTLFDIAGAVLFVIIKSLQYRRRVMARNELLKLQARVSTLRIALKSKVKKRSNSFRSYFPKAIPPNGQIDGELNALGEIRFESGADFQRYFEMIKKIHLTLAELPKTFESPIEGFRTGDEQTALYIAKVIKEMKESTQVFNLKAESFNKLNPQKRIATLDPMTFDAMAEIEGLLQIEEKLDAKILADTKSEAA